MDSINEKNYKILRQDESILLRIIIGVQEKASISKILKSLNIQEVICTVIKTKK
jgi:hypothetical protein